MYKTYLLTALCGVLACSLAYAATCTDSDNGADIYTKGTMTVGTKVYVDGCDKTGSVKEFTCISTRSTAYHCPKGCSNGACIRPQYPDFFLQSADIQYLENSASTNALGLTFQRVTAVVRNDGLADAAVPLTYTYTTFSSVTNTRSAVEKTITLPSITAGSSQNVVIDITDVGDNAICTGTVNLYVDRYNTVVENVEANNDQVLQVQCPDFAIEGYTLLSDKGYGVEATFTIKNYGSIAAAPRSFWLTGYDAAGNYAVILHEDTLMTPLASMESITLTRMLPGDRCAIANKATRVLVDAESIGSNGVTIVSAVDEANASNNAAFKNFICSLPDFQVIAFSASYTNGMLDLDIQISNRGTGTPAMSGVTRVVDVSGVEVARFDPVLLSAGQNARFISSVLGGCGLHTAEVLAASDGRREMSMTNNALSADAVCPIVPAPINSTNTTG